MLGEELRFTHVKPPRKLTAKTLLLDKYRKTLEGRFQKKNPRSFYHQIHENLATDIVGVSFDAQ